MSTRKIAEADFPTRWGHFRILGFEGFVPGTPATGSPDGTERRKEEAVALVMGDIHSEHRWSASTRSALRATSSIRCGAIAASNWSLRSR